MQNKSIFKSKTFWVQVLGVLAVIFSSFSPSVGAFLKLHFAEAGGAWALINIVLRLITKDKVFLV